MIACGWAALFVVFGAFVYLPLARSLDLAAFQVSASPDLPAWVLPFQMVRALLWVAVTLPLIRMMKGSWWETGLAVALLYSVLMGSSLLMATDMPTGLRLAHLVEVFGEAFVFGWIVVALLHGRHESRQTRMIPLVSQ